MGPISVPYHHPTFPYHFHIWARYGPTFAISFPYFFFGKGGHSKQHVKDPEEAAARAQRTANRRRRRAEIAEKEVEEKGKRVDDTGQTADEIFYEAKPEGRL